MLRFKLIEILVNMYLKTKYMNIGNSSHEITTCKALADYKNNPDMHKTCSHLKVLFRTVLTGFLNYVLIIRMIVISRT